MTQISGQCAIPSSITSAGNACLRPVTPVFDLPSGDDMSPREGDESDEFTLSAYGDISLSNIYFVPGLPSDVSPRRRNDSSLTNESTQTPPPSPRKAWATNAEHPLPSVIQKILPPSPADVQLSPGTDFERLVTKLRETRISENNPLHPGLAIPSPSKPIHQPQPRHAINMKAIGNLNAKANTGLVSITEREPLLPTARRNAPKPKNKEKPFRGVGKLPVRPPLPRWDMYDFVAPQVIAPRGAMFDVSSKVADRT